jgi:hypothetical protein
MADDLAAGSVVPAQAAAAAIPVPPGWALRYDEHGRPALLRQEDVAAWEHEHGLIAEQYDLPSAADAAQAAHAALAPAMAQAVAEFGTLGYVRDEMIGALNAAMGGFVDAYRHLMKTVGATLPREAEVVDFAHRLQTLGKADLHPSLLARLERLAGTVSQAQLDAHLARVAADQAAQQQQTPSA